MEIITAKRLPKHCTDFDVPSERLIWIGISASATGAFRPPA
jgi:hypothetical protein